jgi:two-component system, OmpR family, phosphate regulon sensor histidine kinase PhoR
MIPFYFHKNGMSMQSNNLQALGELINKHRNELLSSWHNEVSLLPGASDLDAPTIIDHIPQLLTELSQKLMSNEEQPGHIASSSDHGVQRWKVGFDITEVVAEYGILRGCLDRLAEKNSLSLTNHAGRVVNSVFDKAVAEATKAYATYMTIELQKRREEHLSFVVHDLRTPLQAIALSTSVLERSLPEGATPEQFSKSLLILRRNIARLDALILRVLQDNANLQLVESPKIEPREFDLWPIVEGIIQDLHPIVSETGTVLINDIPSDLTIVADARLLAQVFQNLLSNAIKFTPNEKVTVGAKLSESAEVIQCWVQDSGAGIEPERLAKIFEKLETDQQPEKRGMGLGLAIVKQIVELHGGKVAVESTVGAGSTFKIELPQNQFDKAVNG